VNAAGLEQHSEVLDRRRPNLQRLSVILALMAIFSRDGFNNAARVAASRFFRAAKEFR